MSLVATHMAQELAEELHAKGIYFEMSEEQSRIYPDAICNIGGSINAIACFTERKRSSESYFLLSDGNGFSAKVGSVNEAMMTLRTQGIKTRLDRELDNLVKAIQLTGRNAEIDSNNTEVVYYNKKLAKSVIFGGKVIEVIIYGVYPYYCFEGKWTYYLDQLFDWLGVDTLNGFKLFSPVEISYNKYGVKCEAVGTFSKFRFDFEYRKGIRELVNVGAFVHVVSEGELLGGGVESESGNMRPHTPTEDRPFRGMYKGVIYDFRLADNYMADTESGLFPLVNFGLHVEGRK